jgi:hypothetical protein
VSTQGSSNRSRSNQSLASYGNGSVSSGGSSVSSSSISTVTQNRNSKMPPVIKIVSKMDSKPPALVEGSLQIPLARAVRFGGGSDDESVKSINKKRGSDNESSVKTQGNTKRQRVQENSITTVFDAVKSAFDRKLAVANTSKQLKTLLTSIKKNYSNQKSKYIKNPDYINPIYLYKINGIERKIKSNFDNAKSAGQLKDESMNWLKTAKDIAATLADFTKSKQLEIRSSIVFLQLNELLLLDKTNTTKQATVYKQQQVRLLSQLITLNSSDAITALMTNKALKDRFANIKSNHVIRKLRHKSNSDYIDSTYLSELYKIERTVKSKFDNAINTGQLKNESMNWLETANNTAKNLEKFSENKQLKIRSSIVALQLSELLLLDKINTTKQKAVHKQQQGRFLNQLIALNSSQFITIVPAAEMTNKGLKDKFIKIKSNYYKRKSKNKSNSNYIDSIYLSELGGMESQVKSSFDNARNAGQLKNESMSWLKTTKNMTASLKEFSKNKQLEIRSSIVSLQLNELLLLDNLLDKTNTIKQKEVHKQQQVRLLNQLNKLNKLNKLKLIIDESTPGNLSPVSRRNSNGLSMSNIDAETYDALINMNTSPFISPLASPSASRRNSNDSNMSSVDSAIYEALIENVSPFASPLVSPSASPSASRRNSNDSNMSSVDAAIYETLIEKTSPFASPFISPSASPSASRRNSNDLSMSNIDAETYDALINMNTSPLASPSASRRNSNNNMGLNLPLDDTILRLRGGGSDDESVKSINKKRGSDDETSVETQGSAKRQRVEQNSIATVPEWVKVKFDRKLAAANTSEQLKTLLIATRKNHHDRKSNYENNSEYIDLIYLCKINGIEPKIKSNFDNARNAGQLKDASMNWLKTANDMTARLKDFSEAKQLEIRSSIIFLQLNELLLLDKNNTVNEKITYKKQQGKFLNCLTDLNNSQSTANASMINKNLKDKFIRIKKNHNKQKSKHKNNLEYVDKSYLSQITDIEPKVKSNFDNAKNAGQLKDGSMNWLETANNMTTKLKEFPESKQLEVRSLIVSLQLNELLLIDKINTARKKIFYKQQQVKVLKQLNKLKPIINESTAGNLSPASRRNSNDSNMSSIDAAIYEALIENASPFASPFTSLPASRRNSNDSKDLNLLPVGLQVSVPAQFNILVSDSVKDRFDRKLAAANTSKELKILFRAVKNKYFTGKSKHKNNSDYTDPIHLYEINGIEHTVKLRFDSARNANQLKDESMNWLKIAKDMSKNLEELSEIKQLKIRSSIIDLQLNELLLLDKTNTAKAVLAYKQQQGKLLNQLSILNQSHSTATVLVTETTNKDLKYKLISIGKNYYIKKLKHKKDPHYVDKKYLSKFNKIQLEVKLRFDNAKNSGQLEDGSMSWLETAEDMTARLGDFSESKKLAVHSLIVPLQLNELILLDKTNNAKQKAAYKVQQEKLLRQLNQLNTLKITIDESTAGNLSPASRRNSNDITGLNLSPTGLQVSVPAQLNIIVSDKLKNTFDKELAAANTSQDLKILFTKIRNNNLKKKSKYKSNSHYVDKTYLSKIDDVEHKVKLNFDNTINAGQLKDKSMSWLEIAKDMTAKLGEFSENKQLEIRSSIVSLQLNELILLNKTNTAKQTTAYKVQQEKLLNQLKQLSTLKLTIDENTAGNLLPASRRNSEASSSSKYSVNLDIFNTSDNNEFNELNELFDKLDNSPLTSPSISPPTSRRNSNDSND